MSDEITIHTTPQALRYVADRLEAMWQRRAPQQVVEYVENDGGWLIRFRVNAERMAVGSDVPK